jgi:hypothetical protein
MFIRNVGIYLQRPILAKQIRIWTFYRELTNSSYSMKSAEQWMFTHQLNTIVQSAQCNDTVFASRLVSLQIRTPFLEDTGPAAHFHKELVPIYVHGAEKTGFSVFPWRSSASTLPHTLSQDSTIPWTACSTRIAH